MKDVLILFLLTILFFAGFIIFFNREKNGTIVELTEKESPANVYVWDHMPLTYYLEEDCMTRDNGEFAGDIERALELITMRTEGIINFERIESERPDIFYICSEEHPDGLFGEAHPFFYVELRTYAPGKVYYYRADDCERPIVMIHETLHMLGLNHGTNRTRDDVMRAKYRLDGNACDRDIVGEDLEFLKKTYGSLG